MTESLIEKAWQRFAGRVLEGVTWSHIGRVDWVPIEFDTWHRGNALVASGGLCIPWQERAHQFAKVEMWHLGQPGEWPGFRRWPNLLELIPTFRAQRGGIRFVSPT